MKLRFFFITLLVLFFFNSANSTEKIKSDFENSNILFNTIEEWSLSFINSLNDFDSAKILNHFISKEELLFINEIGTKLLLEGEDVEYIEDSLNTVKEYTESNYHELQQICYNVSLNLKRQIVEDSVDLSNVYISVEYEINDRSELFELYEIDNYYDILNKSEKLNLYIEIASVIITLIHDNQIYSIGIFQLTKINNNWTIIYPMIICQNELISFDLIEDTEVNIDEKSLEELIEEIYKKMENENNE